MAQWMVWMILTGVMVILEMFSGTFYLLMIAIGTTAGALAAYLNTPLEWQLIVAAIVGMAATMILRRSRVGSSRSIKAASDPNVNLDIGQSINVPAWVNPVQPDARATARVQYRGAQWDVECAEAGQAMPGEFVIREMRGSRLIVARTGL